MSRFSVTHGFSSRDHSPWAVALGALLVIVQVAPLRHFFAFDALATWELALAVASGFVALAWFELLEIVRGAKLGA